MATFKLLTRSHAEKSSEGCWNPKELDGDRARSWSEHSASQPFFPRESVVSPLAPREQGRVRFWLNVEGLFQLHVNPLIAHKLHTFPSMLLPTPVTPEERLTPDAERMQQHTHLARLCGGSPIPLALLTQRAGTATAHAGAIHHAQASIGFSALLMRGQLLVSGASQRPIWLEHKILPREATSFPGEADMRGNITGRGSRVQ
jgi:hypothetical protein